MDTKQSGSSAKPAAPAKPAAAASAKPATTSAAVKILIYIGILLVGFVIGALLLTYLNGGTNSYFVKSLTGGPGEEGDESDLGEGADATETDEAGEDDDEDADCEEYDFPVVVFVAAGLFTDAEKTQIEQRIVEPMTAYILETEERQMVSISIEKMDAGDDYDYSILAIYEDGVNTGFLHGDGSGDVDWWVPTCMDECVFSDEFAAEYPEVVDAYGE